MQYRLKAEGCQIPLRCISAEAKIEEISPSKETAPSVPGSTNLRVVIILGLPFAVVPISLARVSPVAVAIVPRYAYTIGILCSGKIPDAIARIRAAVLFENTFS